MHSGIKVTTTFSFKC